MDPMESENVNNKKGSLPPSSMGMPPPPAMAVGHCWSISSYLFNSYSVKRVLLNVIKIMFIEWA